jgi:hypothetical protein
MLGVAIIIAFGAVPADLFVAKVELAINAPSGVARVMAQFFDRTGRQHHRIGMGQMAFLGPLDRKPFLQHECPGQIEIFIISEMSSTWRGPENRCRPLVRSSLHETLMPAE